MAGMTSFTNRSHRLASGGDPQDLVCTEGSRSSRTFRRTLICGICIIVVLAMKSAEAGCRDDSDCDGTLRCLVAQGHESLCGEYLPSIQILSDRERLKRPLRESGNISSACQFNVDCQPGLACFKTMQAAFEGRCYQFPGAGDRSGSGMVSEPVSAASR